MMDWGLLARIGLSGTILILLGLLVSLRFGPDARKQRAKFSYRAKPIPLVGQAIRKRAPMPTQQKGEMPVAIANVASFPITKVSIEADDLVGITPRQALDNWLASAACDPTVLGFPERPYDGAVDIAKRMELVRRGEWPGASIGGK